MKVWRRESKPCLPLKSLAREWSRSLADEALTSKATGEKYHWPQYVSGLAPILMVYVALAVYRMEDQSLWTDEVISVMRASEPIWTRLHSQSPLYFLLLGVWSQLAGTTEFALRSLSTVLGVAAVCITYAIGFRLFNRKIAVFGALLLATSPYLIWYAQEVRYVTLLIATSLLMTYCFHRAISSGLPTWWVSYGVASVVGLFTFITVVFIVMAHGVYVLCSESNRQLFRKWLGCQAITLLVFGVWFGLRSAPKLTGVVTKAPTVTSHEQTRSREILPLADVAGMIPYTFYAFSVGFSFGPSVRELQTSRSVDTLLSHAPTLAPVAVIFASLFLLGLARLWQHRGTGTFLLLWIATPIIGAFVVATITTYHVYNTRYVAMVLPAYIFILVTGIVSFRRPAVQFAMLTCMLSVNGISLANYFFDSRYEREDARSAAQYLESATGPGDVILVVGNITAFRYYYKAAAPIIPFNAREDISVVSENLRALGTDHDRLWLVEIRAWEGDPKRKINATLDNLFSIGEHKAFPGVQIYVYDLFR